ncbi:MAG: polysaccharide biosynthesis protein [Anaerolineae bacterium]|nr:polysaccharide biosynthesis protein [Anaerolineae bacterium]
MIDWPSLRVLVTGGTGSFGNFVVRQLLALGAAEVRVLSRDEKKQHDMRVFYSGSQNLSLVVGDIRDREVVDEAMAGIHMVFQAAALKQVPNCERYPMEAIRTNVLGVENVVQSALANGVQVLVAISTDKAVKPVNVMGMTKALQERLVLRANLSRANRGTRLSCVRYGNVLRSRGSVVPFFRGQLAQGKRLTITDERMTRFLLTLHDAIDLVLYAAEYAQGGEIFVRKAPSARILDIAQVLCEEAGREFEYEVIGVLPGEKLNEILVSEEELARTADCGEYYRVHPWWSTERPAALQQEYSSRDELVGREEVRSLIARADAEFEAMELLGGEFARF